ncbi:hypothetical protein [Undibacterium parvum]|uniref:Uncharacterized protein n=2 Tax=Undibacterium TaxID=401469 RepID=A0A6M3ZZQ1_9BURK|nr:hypothetical protein [Undibacterium parvum]AZP13551.1 hypothetical protein EJN92_17085 [Undibacterium parvum]QJQ04551.1 hypothetical protein EJG51_000355 [Undibacterium piscinae]
MVLQREKLEQPHTLDEMRNLLDRFSADHIAFPDQLVHLRRGVFKDIIEEYAPLYSLANNLEGFMWARLTKESFPGPDAIIQLNDQSQIAIQITTAGETQKTALQREVLSRGESIFRNQDALRILPSKKILMSGRALTTKKANTEEMIEEVKTAIKRKISAYRNGTQCLLILICQQSITMEFDWKSQLRAALLNITFAPYLEVYVTNTDTCTRCAGV